MQAYVYLAPEISQQAVQDLLGIESLASVPAHALKLPRLETTLSQAVNHVLDAARARNSAFMRLRVVAGGRHSPWEREFHCCIVEDRTSGSVSYIEYLCEIHHLISTTMKL